MTGSSAATWNSYGVLSVQSSASSLIASGSSISWPLLNVLGSLTSDATSALLGWPIKSTGTISVTNGALTLSAGGTTNANIAVNPNGSLTFSGLQSFTVMGAAAVRSDGVIKVTDSGILVVNSTSTAAWNVSSASVSSAGNLTLAAPNIADQNQTLSLSAGVLTLNVPLSLATLRMNASGQITTSGRDGGVVLTIKNALLWNGGGFNGAALTVRCSGLVTVDGDAAVKTLQAATLVMSGGTQWLSGSIAASGGALVNNTAAMSITAATGTADLVASAVGACRFVNSGTIVKSGTSASTLSCDLDNRGSILATNGSLLTLAGATNYYAANSSVLASLGAAQLQFSAGQHTFASGSALLIESNVVLLASGGSLTIGGSFNCSTCLIQVNGGAVDLATQEFVSLGSNTISASGTGKLLLSTLPHEITSLPPLNISAAGTVDLRRQTLTLPNVTQSGGFLALRANITVTGLYRLYVAWSPTLSSLQEEQLTWSCCHSSALGAA
jgi:hypothetical protein